MNHKMKLRAAPFDRMRRGEKIVELRLYDAKRRAVAVGDTIRFTNADCPGETLTTRVVALRVFPSFTELYAATSLREYGYAEEELA